MSRQRRNEVSLEARTRRPSRTSGCRASGIPITAISASRQSMLNSTTSRPMTVRALLQQVAGDLGDGRLDLLDVGRDVAHQRARAAVAQERERLGQDVLVEGVAQVGDGPVPRGGDQRRGEIGPDPFEEVEPEDQRGYPACVDALDQHIVEDRLHGVDQQRPGGGVHAHGDPGQAQAAEMGASVGAQSPDQPKLAPNLLPGAPRLVQAVQAASPAALGQRGQRRCDGEGDDLISLRSHTLVCLEASVKYTRVVAICATPAIRLACRCAGWEGDPSVDQSTKRYLIRVQRAGKPSLQVIFLPSE